MAFHFKLLHFQWRRFHNIDHGIGWTLHNLNIWSKPGISIVSMLLIWSLVSLYDQLPEADIIMRW